MQVNEDLMQDSIWDIVVTRTIVLRRDRALDQESGNEGLFQLHFSLAVPTVGKLTPFSELAFLRCEMKG